MISNLHGHTENSLQDSALSVKRYVSIAKSLGATSLAITDHGNVMGVNEFYKECLEQNIKPIIGVELYCNEDKLKKREHLVLLAKNEKGYKEICNIITNSNKRIQGKKKKIPVANKEMLKNAITGENVIALSGCVQGVLATILLQNEDIKAQICKLEKLQEKYTNPNDANYQSHLQTASTLEKEIFTLTSQRDVLVKDSKITYKKLEKKAKKLMGDEKDALEREIAELIAKKEYAENNLPIVREQLAKKKKSLTITKNTLKSINASMEHWTDIHRKINSYISQIQTKEELIKKVKQEVVWYKNLFGENNFYVELQYHGLETEKNIFPVLAQIAEETNTPVVATNDTHIGTNSKEDVLGRHIQVCNMLGHWNDIEPQDKELYLKTNVQLKEALLQILPEPIVDKAIANIAKIADTCNCTLHADPHFPVFRDKTGTVVDSVSFLRKKCMEGKTRLEKQGVWNEKYEKRMEYELDVIQTMGYCDYLCIVLDFIQYAQKKALDNPEHVGVGVGFGRGSAAGSLVCFLTGITSVVDPIQYNLLFERFLNQERVSMPDIDTDFANSIRELAIQYVTEIYGENAVCAIMTKQTQAAKEAIRTAARVYSYFKINEATRCLTPEEASNKKIVDEKASTVQKKYLQIADRLSKCVMDDDTWLTDLGPLTKEEKEIRDWAKSIKGSITSTATHAAGIIISDNYDISEYIPLMYDTNSKQWKTQCNMIEAEENGLLKMDFLGLSTLDIITLCFRAIKKNHNISLTIEDSDIPIEEEVISAIFASGRTNGIFQFESDGMKDTLRSFNPKTIEDLILLNAVYRPGPMQYIPDILAVKKGEKKPKYLIDGMEEILAPTYGYPVYQEQIMQLFQLAGFSLGQADIIRRYMSKKKTEKFMEYQYTTDTHPGFVDGFISKGASKEDALALWEQLLDFSKYAFNKSHAAVYAVLAYKTGWLKYYYPAEYTAAYLSIKPKTIPIMMKDMPWMKVTLNTPSINHSELNFKNIQNKIMVGLASLKYVNQSANAIIQEREQNGIYRSVFDVLLRLKIDKQTYESLIQSGAFDEFQHSRACLLQCKDDMLDLAKKYHEKKAIIHNPDASLTSIENAKKALKTIKEEIANFEYPDYLKMDKEAILSLEKDVIGTYISGHPLDLYKNPLPKQTIANASLGNKKQLYGYLDDIHVLKDKNDNLMAFGTLVDKSNTSINVCIFHNTYAKLQDLIKEGPIILIGKLEEKFSDFKGEMEKNFILDDIKKPEKKDEFCLLCARNIIHYQKDLLPLLQPFIIKEGGYSLGLFFEHEQEVRTTRLRVTPELLTNKVFKTKLL